MPDHLATDSGIPVKTSYDNRDASATTVRSLGKPGEFPYTRGIYPNMYRDRLWTMRQYTGFGSARVKTVSVIMAPLRIPANDRAAEVMIGREAFLKAWWIRTLRSGNPLALAVTI